MMMKVKVLAFGGVILCIISLIVYCSVHHTFRDTLLLQYQVITSSSSNNATYNGTTTIYNNDDDESNTTKMTTTTYSATINTATTTADANAAPSATTTTQTTATAVWNETDHRHQHQQQLQLQRQVKNSSSFNKSTTASSGMRSSTISTSTRHDESSGEEAAANEEATTSTSSTTTTKTKIMKNIESILKLWNTYKQQHSSMTLYDEWMETENIILDMVHNNNSTSNNTNETSSSEDQEMLLPISLSTKKQKQLLMSTSKLYQRKYSIIFYSCPNQAGNRLHHMLNGIIWSVITNRTILYTYYDKKTCEIVGYDHGSQICNSANIESDCTPHILDRATWISSSKDIIPILEYLHSLVASNDDEDKTNETNDHHADTNNTTSTNGSATTIERYLLAASTNTNSTSGNNNSTYASRKRKRKRPPKQKESHSHRYIRPKILSYWSTYEALHSHRRWYDGAEQLAGIVDNTNTTEGGVGNIPVVVFGQMLGQDTQILNVERKRNRLLQTNEARERARTLLSNTMDIDGTPDFLYGLILNDTFTILPNYDNNDDDDDDDDDTVVVQQDEEEEVVKDSAVVITTTPKAAATKTTTTAATTTTSTTKNVTIVLHSRHSNVENDGSNIQKEIHCIHQVIHGINEYRRHQQRELQKENVDCRVILLSDRNTTLSLLMDYLSTTTASPSATTTTEQQKGRRNLHGKNSTTSSKSLLQLPFPCYGMVASHTTGSSFKVEHGPYAGVGFYEDLKFVETQQQLRGQSGNGNVESYDNFGIDGWIGMNRSSSFLVREMIVYHREMQIYTQYYRRQPEYVGATTTTAIPPPPPPLAKCYLDG